MNVIIPAAGIGTRLRPLTHTIPKSLIYVAGKPILGHIIDTIPPHLGEFLIVIGYMADRVREYVDRHYDLPKRYIFQQERLGLGHAVWLALQEAHDDQVLILLGDTVTEVDLPKVLSLPTSAIGVREVEDPRRFGVVEVKNGMVERIVEKPSEPRSNLIIAGIYFIKNAELLRQCLDEIVHKDITTSGEYQLTDALQRMVELGEPMRVFDVPVWLDCGKPETVLATNRHLLKKHHSARHLGTSITIPPVYIDESAKVTTSIVGPYVSVAAHAEIRRAIVRDSIVGANARVSDTLLYKSLIGAGASVKGTFRRMITGDSSEILSK